jgi:hypothetical protein
MALRDFTLSKPFRGDAGKAFDTAASILMPHGFVVLSRSADQIEFDGPPIPYQQHSPFWGAGVCRLRRKNGQIQLDVSMSTWRRSNRWGLGMMLGVIGPLALLPLALMVWDPHDPVPVWLAAGLGGGVVVLTIIVMALLLPMFHRRIRDAYDRLLRNAVALG